MMGMEHKINKTGHRQGYLQHLRVRKEVPERHLHREIPQIPSRKSTCWGACTEMQQTWEINEVSQRCVWLQGHSLAGITEVCGMVPMAAVVQWRATGFVGGIGWEAGHKQSRQFLECVDNFLTQETEESTRKGVLLEAEAYEDIVYISVFSQCSSVHCDCRKRNPKNKPEKFLPPSCYYCCF